MWVVMKKLKKMKVVVVMMIGQINCLTTYLWESKFTEVVVICSFSLPFSDFFVVRLYIVFHNETIYHVPIRWFST